MADSGEQRTAIVTGGRSGIGRATAQLLVERGLRVLAVDVAAPEGTLPRGMSAAVVDIRDHDQVESAVSDFVAENGRIDVLVNSAGVLRWGGTVETTEDDWDMLFDTNVKGTWQLSRSVIPHMVAAGRGSIVHVASNMGMKGVANQIAYSASKGAVIALTRSMAVELGPSGIRVNCVNPGHISTPMGDGAALRLGLTLEGIRERYPLGRIGHADEVAQAIAYLAEEQSSFITGAILAVDGGYTA
ncbi:SDR family NAD(P)-dependent oxidoreductase [Microbacterium sp.]|uniref:SDR family NAD(P)-dependent oxidoreductase n=1 Tax=Microbacterium sp. TaxID=51671 RepID=UPI003A913CE1